MRILATGGAGFIGSHVVCDLLDKGCDVLNIDKLTYAGSLDNLGVHLNDDKHRFEKVDICDVKSIKKLFDDFKPEKVLHMAAESHVDRSIDSPQTFIETNVNGAHNILKTAYDFWVSLDGEGQSDFKFIHLSTDEVFGALAKEDTPFTEESPYKPNSPYSASKASSDLLVRSYYKTYDFPAVIINTSNNYGPRQYPEKLIPLMVLSALEERALPVYGKGEQIRDWLYVEDHVDGLWRALKDGKAGETYCIGGNCEKKNIDIVHMICDILDAHYPRENARSYHDLIEFVADRPGHDFRYAIDSDKAKKELGWQPKQPFDQRLEQTVHWYVEQKDKLLNVHKRQRQGKAGAA